MQTHTHDQESKGHSDNRTDSGEDKKGHEAHPQDTSSNI